MLVEAALDQYVPVPHFQPWLLIHVVAVSSNNSSRIMLSNHWHLHQRISATCHANRGWTMFPLQVSCHYFTTHLGSLQSPLIVSIRNFFQGLSIEKYNLMLWRAMKNLKKTASANFLPEPFKRKSSYFCILWELNLVSRTEYCVIIPGKIILEGKVPETFKITPS